MPNKVSAKWQVDDRQTEDSAALASLANNERKPIVEGKQASSHGSLEQTSSVGSTVEPAYKVHVLSKKNGPYKWADLISGL